MDPLLLVRMVECEESPEKVFSKLRLRLSAKRTAQSSQSVVHAWTLEERKKALCLSPEGWTLADYWPIRKAEPTGLTRQKLLLWPMSIGFSLPYCPCTYDGDPSCRYYRGAVAIYEGKVCCVKEIQFGCSPYGCCYCVSWPIYSTYITGPAGHLLATTSLPSQCCSSALLPLWNVRTRVSGRRWIFYKEDRAALCRKKSWYFVLRHEYFTSLFVHTRM